MDSCPREHNFAPVWIAAQTFDERKPLDTYAMDDAIQKLFNRADFRIVRRQLRNAVLYALHRADHKRNFPDQERNAKAFLAELKNLRELLLSIKQHPAESFSNVLTIPRHSGRDPEEEVLEIEDRTATLQQRAAELADKVGDFLTEITLPDSTLSKTSNREVPFTACLIDKVAEVWKQLRAEPARADLGDITNIVGAVLLDFSYQTEVRGRNWLRNRIEYRLFDRSRRVGIE